MDNCLGIVLAGGRSLRMGEDKGLCVDGGVPWSRLAYNKLSSVCNRVVISVSPSQKASYSSLFSDKDIVVDSVSYMGPFNGLVSVYESLSLSSSLDSFFLLACDMLYMSNSLMSALVLSYGAHRDYDFYLYTREGGFAEPLCGIYRISFIERFISTLASPYPSSASSSPSLDKGLSFRKVLSFGKGFYIAADSTDYKYFSNVNSPSDLDSNTENI